MRFRAHHVFKAVVLVAPLERCYRLPQTVGAERLDIAAAVEGRRVGNRAEEWGDSVIGQAHYVSQGARVARLHHPVFDRSRPNWA